MASTSLKRAVYWHNHPEFDGTFPNASADFGFGSYVHVVYPARRFWTLQRWRYLDHRWFCVVRDPVERVVSGFGERIIRQRKLENDRDAVLSANLSVAPEIDAFVANLHRYRRVSPQVRHHFAPLHTFLGRRPERFDRIFSLHEMDAVARYLADAGAPMEIPRPSKSGPAMSVDALQPESRKAVQQIFAEDYRIFGRYF